MLNKLTSWPYARSWSVVPFVLMCSCFLITISSATVLWSGICLPLIDWLIDYGRVRLTSQNRGHHWPIVHPPGECEWTAVVMIMMMMMMTAGDNSWLVYHSSLAVLPAETSGASRRNGRRNENFAYSVSLIRQRIFYFP
jgi:hypothetical protein